MAERVKLGNIVVYKAKKCTTNLICITEASSVSQRNAKIVIREWRSNINTKQ